MFGIIKYKLAYGLRKALMLFFRVFPLQNKVYFSDFRGKRYGDSPRVVSEELHKANPSCRIVWELQDGFSFSDVPKYVNVVKRESLRGVYELSTSRVWVDSHIKELWVSKRKKQFFIETWHGGLGFKKIEGDVDNKEAVSWELARAYHTSAIADLFISNSEWISNIYISAFAYKGEILKCGYPKNDIFFSDNLSVVTRVRKHFNISNDSAILLYAPTFRDVINKKAYDIDFNRLLDAIKERFEIECTILVRLHPRMMKLADDFFDYSDNIIDATGYPNVQDLILSADYMITDYSSAIFDFMLLRRPGFLFTADYDDYIKERGFYQQLDYYPFSASMNNAELIENIIRFDDEDYQKKLDIFIKKTGLYENGNATEEIVKVILTKLKN